jgi:hypothetical protein
MRGCVPFRVKKAARRDSDGFGGVRRTWASEPDGPYGFRSDSQGVFQSLDFAPEGVDFDDEPPLFLRGEGSGLLQAPVKALHVPFEPGQFPTKAGLFGPQGAQFRRELPEGGLA